MQYYPTLRDPKQIRRDIRSVVLSVAAFILVLQVFSAIVIYIAFVVDHFDAIIYFYQGGDDIASEGLTEFLTSAFLDSADKYSGMGMLIAMLCGVPIFFIIRGKKFVTSDIVRVNSKAKLGTILILLLCIFGIQGFMYLISIVFEPLFNQGGGSLTDALDESTTSLALSFWGALYIAVIGPICEELVFRGAVMRKLERYGANFAIIISSLLFALYHLILFQAVFAFFIGIILAYTAGRFSLKWSILLHIINNTMAIIPLFVNSDFLSVALFIFYILAFIAAGIIVLVMNKQVTAQRTAGAPSEPRVFARAFASPWLIIYIVLTSAAAFLLLGFF